MKNIHIIPTTGASRLKSTGPSLLFFELSKQSLHWRHACYVYITSDEDIQINDWYLDTFNDQRLVATDFSDHKHYGSACKKIVLTNDTELIAAGVQEISNAFLEWFVQNTTCKHVDLVAVDLGDDKIGYEIKKPNIKKSIDIEGETFQLVFDKKYFPQKDILPEEDLAYWKNNCEEDYLHTPISVLKYISKLEEALNIESNE